MLMADTLFRGVLIIQLNYPRVYSARKAKEIETNLAIKDRSEQIRLEIESLQSVVSILKSQGASAQELLGIQREIIEKQYEEKLLQKDLSREAKKKLEIERTS